MRWIIWVVLLAVTAGFLAAEEPRRLFYAPFDGTADATFALGEAKAWSRGGGFAPGVKGQALDTRGMEVLRYRLDKNLSAGRGTVMFWYRPQWGEPGARLPIRSLFSTDRPAGTRLALLSIFAWSSCVRGDLLSTPGYDITKGGNRLEDGHWSHIAFTWNGSDTILFVDGLRCARSGSYGAPNLMLRPGFQYPELPRDRLAAGLEYFYIGSDCPKGRAPAAGLIDEFEIWDAPLVESAIRAKAAELSPLYASHSVNRYILAGTPGERPKFELINSSTEPVAFDWECLDASGTRLAGSKQTVMLPPGKTLMLRPELAAAVPGIGVLKLVSPDGKLLLLREIVAMEKRNPYESPEQELVLEPVFTLRPHELTGNAARFAASGECRTGELDGTAYLETGSRRGDRFAVRMTFPEPKHLYLIEIDYPDDRKRTADIVFQQAGNSATNFELQVGYLTGDDCRITGKTVTSSRVYFPSACDVAMIVMAARKNAPAAVSEVRVSRIKNGLPGSEIVSAPPVEGLRRTIGISFEDPSIASQFGMDPLSSAGAVELADRLAAYMNFSGQDSLFYPVVFYGAPVDDIYSGRAHGVGWLGAMLRRFQASGLGFYAAFNMYALPGYDLRPKELVPGQYNDSPLSILATGMPSTSGLHHLPPLFNVLHPEVEKYVKSCIDRVIDEVGDNPALQGFVFNMSPRSLLSFGKLEAGYNDYTIAAFEHDTGIRIPVDRSDPMRGKLYADWLLAHEKQRWLDWRAARLADFYGRIIAYIRSKRDDLALVINPRFSYSRFINDPDFMDKLCSDRRLREAGFAPGLYKKYPGIVFMPTAFPALYRHRDGMKGVTEAIHRRLGVIETEPEYYNLALEGSRAALNLHDIYWESQIGGGFKKNGDYAEKDKPAPLVSSWLRETVWRVGTLNSSGRDCLKGYVLPLRYGDFIAYSKGGFLIGSYGTEPYLREFARAFRILPAVKFSDRQLASPVVRWREAAVDGFVWSYLVNTSDAPVSLRATVPDGTVDPVSGQVVAPGEWTVLLAPWQLRVFRHEKIGFKSMEVEK